MNERGAFSASAIETAFYVDRESFAVMTPKEVGSRLSPYGNFFFNITDRDIDDLKRGKILYFREEYGIAIRYKSTAREEKSEVTE